MSLAAHASPKLAKYVGVRLIIETGRSEQQSSEKSNQSGAWTSKPTAMPNAAYGIGTTLNMGETNTSLNSCRCLRDCVDFL